MMVALFASAGLCSSVSNYPRVASSQSRLRDVHFEPPRGCDEVLRAFHGVELEKITRMALWEEIERSAFEVRPILGKGTVALGSLILLVPCPIQLPKEAEKAL
jgi:hypothetical protein